MLDFYPLYNFFYFPNSLQNKQISIKYNNYNIQANLCNVIVFNQNQFKTVPINQIGNKMQLIWKEADFPKIKFNKDYFLAGLAYLHGLSPDETQLVGYLYKFSDEDTKDLEYLLKNNLNLNIKIQTAKGFKFFTLPSDFRLDLENLTNLENLVNFLFGLSLSFGKFEIKEDKLLTIKINLPNLPELTSQNENLINLFEKLFLKQIFVNYNKIDKFLTITIHDRQILEAIASLIQPITGKLIIPKKEKNKILVEKLREKFNIDKNLKLKIW